MFIVLLRGKGEGCGDTIGCNRRWETLQASSWEEARVEVEGLVLGFTEPRVAVVTILEVVREERIFVADWYRRHEEDQVQRNRDEEKQMRRAQYEALKREFEGVPGTADVYRFHIRDDVCMNCGCSLGSANSLQGLEDLGGDDRDIGRFRVGENGYVRNNGGDGFTFPTDQVDFRCVGCGEPVAMVSRRA